MVIRYSEQQRSLEKELDSLRERQIPGMPKMGQGKYGGTHEP